MWWQPQLLGRHSILPFHPSSGCSASHSRVTRSAGLGDQRRLPFPFSIPQCGSNVIRTVLEHEKVNGTPFIVNGRMVLPQQYKRLWHFCHSLCRYILDGVLACPAKSCGRFLHNERNGAAMVPKKDTGIFTSVRPYLAGRSPTDIVPNR